jgi:hypothetical protein
MEDELIDIILWSEIPAPNQMKSLEIHREKKGSRLKVECAGRLVSVSSYCAFCSHCRGLDIGERTVSPPLDAFTGRPIAGGMADDALMQAVMQFNSLADEARAIACDDDEDTGFVSRFRS